MSKIKKSEKFEQSNQLPWIEKYRPSVLEDIIGNNNII